MLDLRPSTGEEVDDVIELLGIVISNALQTSFESRVFNPRLGTSAPALLQEPADDVIYLFHTQSILMSAIERAIPYITVRLNLNIVSSGRGTADLRIKMDISFKGNTYNKEYSSELKGFVN